MKWNDLILIFLWIFMVCITLVFWQNRVMEELFYQKFLLDRIFDTIAEDCLYASIEGIREDFEPIINAEYLLEVFETEKNWMFGTGNVEIPLLFLTEKEQERVYSVHERAWDRYPISGFDRNSDTYAYQHLLSMSEMITRTDEIQKILEEKLNSEPNRMYAKKRYQLYLPYIEQEEGIQKIEKTGLWYPFFSKSYRINGKEFDFFTYSGARSSRKQRMDIEKEKVFPDLQR